MSKSLELELRIEAVYSSWFRNGIILITLASALKSIDLKISNILLLLSLCVMLYTYINLKKLENNISKNKLNSIYTLLSILLLCALLVL